MDQDRLLYPYIRNYLASLQRPREGVLGELERQARAENFPISSADVANLLEFLCKLRRPQKILEIGTCIGFSALLMASCCLDAEITTIERNPVMVQAARKNFQEFSVPQISLLEGDAAVFLPHLEGPFDLIYLDGAKGQYPAFFPHCLRLLAPEGLLIADDILFRGYVASGIPDVRRNKTIVTRLDRFLRILRENKSLQTVFLPLGDGVSVSWKRREDHAEKT